MGKSPGNHKQEYKSTSKKPQTFIMHAGHAREKPHLLICACVISDLELKNEVSAISDAGGPEK